VFQLLNPFKLCAPFRQNVLIEPPELAREEAKILVSDPADDFHQQSCD